MVTVHGWVTSPLRTKAFFLHLVIFAAKAGGENRMRSGRRPLCSAPGCPVNCNHFCFEKNMSSSAQKKACSMTKVRSQGQFAAEDIFFSPQRARPEQLPLLFHAAGHNAADDVLGQEEVDDDNREDGEGDHDVDLAHIKLEPVGRAQLGNENGQGLDLVLV